MDIIKQARSLFTKVFGTEQDKKASKVNGFFATLSDYNPAFNTWNGKLYESELVRAAIHAKAKHISKLAIDIAGSANPKLRSMLRSAPNNYQTWSQYLYRLATIYEMQNNAWIVPVINDDNEMVGYYPVLPSEADILEDEDSGEPWLRFRFRNGQTAYVELNRCGLMNKFQYEHDFFGETNHALDTTLDMIETQKQGIKQGIINSATFRFMASASNFADPKDLAKEMRRFNKQNLRGESGGILLFPTEYTNVKQIEQKAYSLDAEQMKVIQDNVYNYFGVNAEILTNTAIGDKWAAFYDGELEPFAVQLADVMTRMTFSRREIAAGNRVTVTANRLQYASTQEKLNVSAQMADRGIMNRNEIREIWGLPPIEGDAGEVYLVRGEYKDADEDIDKGDPWKNKTITGGENDAEK